MGEKMNKFDRWSIKGINFIGINYDGQRHFVNTMDTKNLIPVKCPYNWFQIWLGRTLADIFKYR